MLNARTNLVSVVIPCYNQARFLCDAIDSVLNQTYSHREVIVVNDGSTDDTAAVARRYRDVRCVNQVNQGLAAARNTGLSVGAGEYVIFLDADDRLLPNALKSGIECLAECPESVAAAGRWRTIAEDGTSLGEEFHKCTDEDFYTALLRANCIPMPAMVVYRRALFEQVGGFRSSVEIDGGRVSVMGAEDYELYLRMARDFTVARHDDLVAEYRQHNTSMSRDCGRMLKAVLGVLHAQRSYICENAVRQKAYKQGVKNWQSLYGEEVVNRLRRRVRTRSDLVGAVNDLKLLLRYHPKAVPVHAFRKLYCMTSRNRRERGLSEREI